MKFNLNVFLTIAFLSLIFMLGNWGLTDSSEARYSKIAKEMVINKDYLNPTLLGIKHFHKPPVTYYLTALGYTIFGINEFGARFFMQLALIFQIFFVFKITDLLYKNKKISFSAALIYFSFPISVISVRTLTTDAYLATFILGSIYFWLQYREKTSPYYLYLFYIFLGLIFETKGPVGLILPITFIVTYKIVKKERVKHNIHQFLGFLLFLLISAAWYLVVINNTDGLFDYFFNNQLVERVSKNKFKRGKPFWYYILIMPLIGLPWLFFWVFYLKRKIKSIVILKNTEYILLITFLVLFTILSISTSKLILYILPLYSLLAILLAKYLSESKPIVIKNISTTFLIIILCFSVASIVVSVFKVIDYNIIYAFIAASIFIAISIIIFKRISNTDYIKPAYLGVVFIILITTISTQIFNENEIKINSVKPIAEFIETNSIETNDYQVLVYNYLLPSLSFYLDKDITTINHGRYTTQRETQFQDNEEWKKHLINYFDKEDRSRILKIDTNKPTYLIMKKLKHKMPDTLSVLQKKLDHKKDFGKFILYY